MKAGWCSVIMEGSNFFNLYARTFGKNFIENITQIDWAKIMHIFRIFYFWYECDESMI